MLDIMDVLAIHDVVSLYGHIIDNREWSRMPEVFTNDTVYDVEAFGQGTFRGLDALREFWVESGVRHPLAHHASNVLVSQDADGTVRVASKGIGVGYRGRVGSTLYYDVMRRTADGWRIAERVCKLRTPDSIPAPS